MEQNDLQNTLKSIEARQRSMEKMLLSQKTVLNFVELSDYTGLSKSFLYKLLSKGEIPGGYKPTGKQWFFERKVIDQWLLSNANGFEE